MVRAGETEAVQLMRTSSGARRRAKEHTAGPTGSSAPGSVTFRATASALALALSACSEPFLCDVCTTSAVVYGVVKRPDGSSVPNAKVSITALREGCVPEGLNGAEGASDTTGRTPAYLSDGVQKRNELGRIPAETVSADRDLTQTSRGTQSGTEA